MVRCCASSGIGNAPSPGLRRQCSVLVNEKMRSLLAIIACLMLVLTASGAAARATGLGCVETIGEVAVQLAADCDEVPADSDKSYPHCHTGCHGQHVAAPMPFRTIVPIFDISRDYAPAARMTVTAHRVDPALRPPQS